MAQQRADVPMPAGIGSSAETYSSSGQAGGGGSGSVFGDLGGPGQQQGDTMINATFDDGPRNSGGHPTNNPSGDGVAPPVDSVFGDLGGSGTAAQTGGAAIPNIPGPDPGGQGGR